MVMMKLGRVLRKVFSSNEGRVLQQANVMVKTFSSGFSGAKVNLLGRTGQQANVMVKTSSTVSNKGFGVENMGKLWSRSFSKGSKRSKKKKKTKGSTPWLNKNAVGLKQIFDDAYKYSDGNEDCLLVGLERVKDKCKMVNEMEEGMNQNREEYVKLIHQVEENGKTNTYTLRILMRKVKDDGHKFIFTVTIKGFCRTISHVTLLVRRRVKNAAVGTNAPQDESKAEAVVVEEEDQKATDIEERDEVDSKKVDVKDAAGEETKDEEPLEKAAFSADSDNKPKEKAEEIAHPPENSPTDLLDD